MAGRGRAGEVTRKMALVPSVQMNRRGDYAEAIEEAVTTLEAWCGTSAVKYFESFRERVDGPADACHAVGIIEGAALALGVTPMELLDDLGHR